MFIKNQYGLSKVPIFIIAFVILIVVGVYAYAQLADEEPASDTSQTNESLDKPLDEFMQDNFDEADQSGSNRDMEDEVSTASYTQSTVLVDVSGGKAAGTAYAKYDGEYDLYAEFSDLPIIDENSEFYEGWIVNRSSGLVISTGEATMNKNGNYTNAWTNEEDLTTSLFYVLTLEPRDGDPAPADHILEGTLK